MKQYVKQHYIPRFYLKNFCSSSSNGIINCYDKVKDNSFMSNIMDIGQENLFYGIEGLTSDEVEKALGRVESRFLSKSYNELLRIKNYGKLSHAFKGWFCLFLAFQLMRTNETRLKIKEMMEKVVFEIAKDEWARETGKKIPDGLTIKFTDPEYVKFLHVDMLWPNLEIFFDLGKYFFNKHWAVLINKTEVPLWTSDNPISFYNVYGPEGNLGIMSPGVEIRFPLSSNLLLFSFDPFTNIPLTNRTRMSTSMVNFANLLQVRSSTRFVYSATNDFKSARNYLTNNPRFRNPKRSRWKVFTDKNRIETIELE
jgi:hypothetical protein